MTGRKAAVAELKARTLTFWGVRSLVFQLVLIGAAVALPVVAHLNGAPVRVLLPMHWPVILAGLVYGWRGGALTGLLAPMASYLVSGMPYPAMLPAMTVELFAYGFMAGLLVEKFRLNSFLAVIIALVVGRVVFAATVLAGFGVSGSLTVYFQAALVPGLFAAVGQVVVLPLIARWWVNKEQN
ncbi:MAG: ECF transporter S component [Candidatus Zixiibacteriota bacterium]